MGKNSYSYFCICDKGEFFEELKGPVEPNHCEVYQFPAKALGFLTEEGSRTIDLLVNLAWEEASQ